MSQFKSLMCLLFVAGGFDLVINTIAGRKGYAFVRITWENYTGKALQEVEKGLSKEFPGVEFAVYDEDVYEIYPEEFYLGRIRLVVRDDVVVLPPLFVGYEPDVSLLKDLLGMSSERAVNIIKKRIPNTKIKVSSAVYKGDGEFPGYILVKIDNKGKVIKPPTVVRQLRG